mmetsp:Transcript_40650/g.49474  ORF Transcript_40650/g.49474 Transcript_40650/m.49474 type:complete len:418 (+) Transcript_40650:42-1295(+)
MVMADLTISKARQYFGSGSSIYTHDKEEQQSNRATAPWVNSRILATAFVLSALLSLLFVTAVVHSNALETIATYQRRQLAVSSNASHRRKLGPAPPVRTTESTRYHTGAKIALMMSFPWSGEDFIQRSIHQMTSLATGTNYGQAIMRKNSWYISYNVVSIPIFEGYTNGPFAFSYDFPIPPNGYVLTRTHCGGHCLACMPKSYVKNGEEFHYECYTGQRYDGENIIPTQYVPEIVDKYMHLIRDPLTTVASRFEQGRKEADEMEYPSGAAGVHKWCHDHDDAYHNGERLEREKDWYITGEEMEDLARKVPCHTDFFRVVQWHNNAFAVSGRELKRKSVKTFFYEDIQANADKFMIDLLAWLELTPLHKHAIPIDDKVSFTVYDRSYYSPQDIENIKKYVQKLASPRTWSVFQKRYFS